MTDDTYTWEGLVGTIVPAKAPGAPTVFQVHKRDTFRTPGPEVRSCTHGQYVLDDRWSTVTCGLCHTKLDAYAVLRVYADWYPHLRRQVEEVKEQRRRLCVDQLRLLIKRKKARPDEIEKMRTLIERYHPSASIEDLQAAVAQYTTAIESRSR